MNPNYNPNVNHYPYNYLPQPNQDQYIPNYYYYPNQDQILTQDTQFMNLPSTSNRGKSSTVVFNPNVNDFIPKDSETIKYSSKNKNFGKGSKNKHKNINTKNTLQNTKRQENSTSENWIEDIDPVDVKYKSALKYIDENKLIAPEPFRKDQVVLLGPDDSCEPLIFCRSYVEYGYCHKGINCINLHPMNFDNKPNTNMKLEILLGKCDTILKTQKILGDRLDNIEKKLEEYKCACVNKNQSRSNQRSSRSQNRRDSSRERINKEVKFSRKNALKYKDDLLHRSLQRSNTTINSD